MCDNLTSTDVEEAECDLCFDIVVCAQAGCKWYPHVYLGSNNEQCFDNSKDNAGILIGGLLLTVSFCFVSWVLGWCIRDSGVLARIRRYGITVNAEVLDRWSKMEMIRTMEGFPMNIESFWCLVEFERPVEKRQWRWMSLERWPPVEEAVPPPPVFMDAAAAEPPVEKWRDAAARLWDDDFEDERLPLFNDPVQLQLKIPRFLWETTPEGEMIRITFDPKEPQTTVYPTGATKAGQIMNKMVLCGVGVAVSTALGIGGVMVLRAAHNCNPKPGCCLLPGTQCEGLGGETHATVCGSVCSSQWMMWAMMGGMFGFMGSLIVVLLRSMNTFGSDTLIGKCFDAACDKGAFCEPEVPDTRRW